MTMFPTSLPHVFHTIAWSVIVVLLAVTTPSMAGAEPKVVPTPHRVRFESTQLRMGAPFRVVVYASDQAAANQAIDATLNRVDQLTAILSDYDPDSELVRFCRSAQPGRPVAVSDELLTVLVAGQQYAERSGGAFDVTVGPLVQLWRKARRLHRLPPPEVLAEARQHVGFRLLALCEADSTATLARSGMRLDLGGIAKGYVADQALAVLREQGISSALIDAGGDLVAGDPPPGRSGWTIGIAPVDNPRAPPTELLELNNVAVATSGDAFQFVEVDGVRYSHIVDPATGVGLTGRSSVTVVAPNGMSADALASAVSVLGPEKGLVLIEATPATAARVVRIDENAGKPTEYRSNRLVTIAVDDLLPSATR